MRVLSGVTVQDGPDGRHPIRAVIGLSDGHPSVRCALFADAALGKRIARRSWVANRESPVKGHVVMGALALVVDEPIVVEVPERFRFSDENPLTLEPYARGRFGDLPPYIEDVIVEQVGLSPTRWNALVGAGEVYSVVGPFQEFSLAGFLRSVRERDVWDGSEDVCGDCWGTLAAKDYDGSVTGRIGGVYVCFCAVH